MDLGQSWVISSMCGTMKVKLSYLSVNTHSCFSMIRTNIDLPEYCYQFRSGWDTCVSFVHCIRTRFQTTYFCINYPSTAFKRLQRAIKQQPDIVYRDFFVDGLAADDGLKQWQMEIGRRRDAVQEFVSVWVMCAFDIKQLLMIRVGEAI